MRSKSVSSSSKQKNNFDRCLSFEANAVSYICVYRQNTRFRIHTKYVFVFSGGGDGTNREADEHEDGEDSVDVDMHGP